jgi:hypothetical protein
MNLIAAAVHTPFLDCVQLRVAEPFVRQPGSSLLQGDLCGFASASRLQDIELEMLQERDSTLAAT